MLNFNETILGYDSMFLIGVCPRMAGLEWKDLVVIDCYKSSWLSLGRAEAKQG